MFNVTDLAMKHIEKMSPEEIGNLIITALLSFEKLPEWQQLTIQQLLNDITNFAK